MNTHEDLTMNLFELTFEFSFTKMGWSPTYNVYLLSLHPLWSEMAFPSSRCVTFVLSYITGAIFKETNI